MSGPVVRSTADPHAFAALAAPLLRAAPVRSSVIATNLSRCLDAPGTDDLWLWAETDGRPVALAMSLPPYGAHLAADESWLGIAVADHLHALGRTLPGVNGWSRAVTAFAERWTALTGARATTLQEQAAHVLGTLVPPTGVPGRSRVAGPADARLLEPWADGFAAEADAHQPPAPPAGRLARQLADGGLRVWEGPDGTPVSMAYASPSHPAGPGGVSRISWVFTPRGHRGHGYAAGVVAAVSAERLAEGARCLLYTDLANPTSNGVYRRIGYERVADALILGLA